MNRVAICGGLGNQMFQFALAISMDASGIPTNISANDFLINRHYQGFELLKAFDVPITIRQRFKLFAVNRARRLLVDVNGAHLRKIVTKLLNNNTNVFKEEREYVFDERVFQQQNSFLIGNWQSINYFETQSDLIREVFNFKKPKDLLNLKLAEEIQNRNSIAVHIRRGDFLIPANAASRLVISSNDYYFKAFNLLKNGLDNPVFYIFSDDISWARQNFVGKEFVFVSHNTGENSFLDMYLMSLCRHFIIANSSFSWWAAWLSESRDKQVIMPYPWVKNTECSGIYPPEWTALKVNSQLIE
ncbi:alpha-1,2-fucosyltransferase [Algoriphagus sp.]|uniref:alpha-1,2-fucosyltransferase n=1 Tax=Algoriphagus sp. TaxID=1872435 RepID=UPI003F72D51B